MIRRNRRVLGAVFGAAIAGALGFGATQAFAAPTRAEGAEFPQCQSNQDCSAEEYCGPTGGICAYPGTCFCPF